MQSLDLVLICAIAGCLLVPVVLRIAQRQFDVFEPFVLFALAYGAMFVVRPAAMITRGEIEYVGPRGSLDVSSTFTEMLALALVGAAAFVGGYLSPLGSRALRGHLQREESNSHRNVAAASLVVGSIGIAAYMYALASTGLANRLEAIWNTGNVDFPDTSSVTYGSYLFLMLVPASIALLAIGLGMRNLQLVGSAGVFALVFALVAVPLGSRMMLLPLFGGFFVFVYVRRGRRPSARMLAVLAILVLVGSSFLSDLRGRSTRDETLGETVSRAVAPSRLASSVTSGPDTEMAPVFAAALTRIPEELPHTYGQTIFRDLLLRPVPRSLWSTKPQVPRERLISAIWPLEHSRGTIDPEFSAVLYFYWDFGVLGVFFGLGTYGVAARVLYEYFMRNRFETYVQAFFALALWFIVIGARDGPVDTLIRMVFVLVPLYAIFRADALRFFGRRPPQLQP